MTEFVMRKIEDGTEVYRMAAPDGEHERERALAGFLSRIDRDRFYVAEEE